MMDVQDNDIKRYGLPGGRERERDIASEDSFPSLLAQPQLLSASFSSFVSRRLEEFPTIKIIQKRSNSDSDLQASEPRDKLRPTLKIIKQKRETSRNS